MSHTKIVGIDGCKFGWCCTIINDKDIAIQLFRNILEITSYLNNNFKALIDIPIGLGSIESERKIDQLLRNNLSSNFKQTVFNTPNRNAVYAKDYKQSRELNKLETNKSVSIQSWNICPKIKEVDSFLLDKKLKKPWLIEAHPELCFQQLNNQKPLTHKKHNQNGIRERLNILLRYNSKTTHIVNSFFENQQSKKIKKDDVLDSLALAYCLKFAKKIKYLQTENYFDNKNIEMKIAYPIL